MGGVVIRFGGVNIIFCDWERVIFFIFGLGVLVFFSYNWDNVFLFYFIW